MAYSLWTLVPLKWQTDSTKLTCVVAVLAASIMAAYSKNWIWVDPEIRKQAMIDELTNRFGKGTVVLLAFPKSPKKKQAVVVSPFSIKMEIFLRLNKIRYATQCEDLLASPLKCISPRIVFNGRIYEDSDEAIFDISKLYNLNMASQLSLGDQAVARSFQMMMEFHFYWLILVSRWVHEKGQFMWDFVPENSSWATRFLMRKMIRSVADKVELASLGLGLKSSTKILQSAAEDIQSVEDFLQTKPFLMGSTVSLADCSVFAFLYLIRNSDLFFESAISFPTKYPKCQAYIDRMTALVDYYS